MTDYNECKRLLAEKRDGFFRANHDPHCRARNHWRNIRQMMANIASDGFIGCESGVCPEAVARAAAWLRAL